MKKMFIVISMLCFQFTFAGVDNVGNGGDICENKFVSIRNDIRSWIISGGGNSLSLPSSTSIQQYKDSMLANIDHVKVSCTVEKLKIGQAEKTCINKMDKANSGIIECNIDRFMQTSESDQYVLVHHEFAGLAGLETNLSEESDYTISNQITYFLENQIVKKLVIKPAPAKLDGAQNAECTTESMMPFVIKSLKDYVAKVATERSIEFIPESIKVLYLGKQEIQDEDTLAALPNQNAFEISFLTKRSSEMVFVTPTHGLCDNKMGFCFSASKNGGVVGLPEPKLVITKDSEGFITTKRCIQYSYDGFNRYILLLNTTLKELVHSSMISYEHSVFTSMDLKLK